MSEPAFKIVTKHCPANGSAIRWEAYVFHIGGQAEAIWDGFGSTERAALEHALDFCKRFGTLPEQDGEYLADASGELISPEPQSLRA